MPTTSGAPSVEAVSPADARIPVYLLTGYLGSGKTSLLKAWLTQPELADAALIINELGEVGLDNELLSAASESSTLVANACVCCTGLPGLEEALEELFWARLHRRIPRFPHLVIETTGLAEPAPVAAALQSSNLLRERYRLAGIVTCLSAPSAESVLAMYAEARAQLAGADLVVLTKTDLIDASSLALLQQRVRHQLESQGHAAPLAESARASLSAAHMLQLVDGHRRPPTAPPADEHQHAHGNHELGKLPGHRHGARACWWPLPTMVTHAGLLSALDHLRSTLGPALLRIKGRVSTESGPTLLQWAPFDPAPMLASDPLGTAERPGLTLIVSEPLPPACDEELARLLASTPS